MADRLQKGHSDGSDNGGNGTLQGFELNRKIEGVEVGCVSAGHSRFNCINFLARARINGATRCCALTLTFTLI